MRIEAARRVFSRCWFNDSATEAGRDALAHHDREHRPEWSADFDRPVDAAAAAQHKYQELLAKAAIA